MHQFLTAFCVLIFTTTLAAQDFTVPANLQLDTPADYAAQEKNVIAAAEWLSATPLDQEIAKRKEVNAYLLKYLTGSPDLVIDLGPLAIAEACPDCLMIFLGGWAKQALTSGDFNDPLAGKLAGVNSVIDFYQANRTFLGTVPKYEKFIRLQQKGKLEKYVRKQ